MVMNTVDTWLSLIIHDLFIGTLTTIFQIDGYIEDLCQRAASKQNI